MDRKIPHSVGDVLRDLLEETQLQSRMEELKAIALWPDVVGTDIASLTSKPGVKDGVMSIGVQNASLRHELQMNRSSIRRFINRYLGKEIIKEIKFTT